MRPPLNVGDSFGGHTVASILGQSSVVEVFTTTDKHLKWDYLENGGHVPPEMVPAVSIFDALMSQIRTHVPKRHREAAYQQLGKALFHALDSTLPSGIDLRYEPVRQFISTCALEDTRLQYVLAFLLSAAGVGGGAAVGAAFLVKDANAVSLLWASACGVAGSAMSVLSRSGTLALNPESGRTFLVLQGACRPALGALFAIFAILACKGDIVLSFAKDRPLTMMAMATLAGFSERFVPEIMSRLEGSP